MAKTWFVNSRFIAYTANNTTWYEAEIFSLDYSFVYFLLVENDDPFDEKKRERNFAVCCVQP